MKKDLDNLWELEFLGELLEGVEIKKEKYLNIFKTPEFTELLSTLDKIGSSDEFFDNFGEHLWYDEKEEDLYSDLLPEEKLSLHLGRGKRTIKLLKNLNGKYKLTFEQLWYLCNWTGIDVKEYLPESIHYDISREKDYLDEIKIRNSQNPEYESIWWDFKQLELSLCKRIFEERKYFSELQGRELQIYIYYNSCETKWRKIANQFLPILEKFSVSNPDLGKVERFSKLCKKDNKKDESGNEESESDQKVVAEKMKYFELCMETFDALTLEMYINMAKDKDKNCLRMIWAYRFVRNGENEEDFELLMNVLKRGHRHSRDNEVNKRVNRRLYEINRKF